MQTDVLIIGSGIAGLSLAIKLANFHPGIRITIITKETAVDCNTRYAQGGIAGVMETLNDSFENHIRDTLACGKGLCDKDIVEMVIRQAPDRINELIQQGVRFNQDEKNNLHFALEGGHSKPRVVHYKDKTGEEIETVLLQQIKQKHNIRLFEDTFVADLATNKQNGELYCVGAVIYDEKSIKLYTITATVTVLATGGCGQVFVNTTNPSVATGDGSALCYRAGAVMKHMRFMQFHPTALYSASQQPVSFLISEAIRGFGAHIVDAEGKRFLFSYDHRGELATRDIITAAIMQHLELSGGKCVFLDLRHLNTNDCKERFPQIIAELEKLNYSIQHDLVPIIPSAHYQCGGVVVNKEGKTSITNLYAIGEVACTGLHGANRLASNSLLEALVFSSNAAHSIIAGNDFTNTNHIPVCIQTEKVKRFSDNAFVTHVAELRKMMPVSFFSADEQDQLQSLNYIEHIILTAEEEILSKRYSKELLQLRNLFQTAQLILADKLASMKTGEKRPVIETS